MLRLLRVPRTWLASTGAFLRARPASLIVVLAAGLAGGGAGAPAGDRIYSYMWRDPTFCGTCHVHDYANEAWTRSVHGSLTTCHDCHRVPIRHYPRNLFVTIFETPQTPEDVPSAEVGLVLCEQCHSDRAEREPLSGPMTDELRVSVAKIDESPLHRAHLDTTHRTPTRYHGGVPKAEAPEAGGEAAEAQGEGASHAIVCLDCHGGADLEVHTFEAGTKDCVTCHEGITPKDEQGADLSCLDCHGRGFLARGSPAPP